MKLIYIPVLIFLTFSANFSIAQQITHRTCGTVSHMNRLMANDPSMVERMNNIENHTANFVATNRPGEINNPIVTIPVVFHILYSNATQNISEARILAQINQLNLDFAKLNTDFNSIPTAFRSLGADTRIQFCLAQRDPAGNTSTGIIRKTTTVTSFTQNDDIKFNATGGDNAWDRNSYLNIWVGNLGNQLLGYAQTPGGPANSDGVVLLYSSVGSMATPGLGAPYNLGRTATHEVGHWLNLRHIWGDDNGSCSGSDLVTDTPNQADANYSCPTFPLTDACATTSPGAMFMNYMDYVDDNCMKMFTSGQSLRMQALFSTGGARVSLLTSNGCQAVSSGSFSFNSIAPVSITCGALSVQGNLTTTTSGGFSTPINLSATGTPTGTSVSFSSNPLTPGNSTNITINNTSNLTPGNYTITINGTAGTTTQSINLNFTVIAGIAPSITTQPTGTTICSGLSTTFSCTTSTAGSTYQWQQSTDGGNSWNNILNATESNFSVSQVNSNMNNTRYRVIVTSQCASTTSNVAILTVNNSVEISSQPSNVVTGLNNTINFSVIASGTGISYQWQDSTNTHSWQNMNGETAPTISISNTTESMHGNKYRVIINSSCGSKTSNAALLEILPFSINPNPNKGIFDVSIYQQDKNKVMRTVSALLIFDSRGAKVFEAKKSASSSTFRCNLSTYPTGIYRVIMLDDTGNKIIELPVLVDPNN